MKEKAAKGSILNCISGVSENKQITNNKHDYREVNQFGNLLDRLKTDLKLEEFTVHCS